MVTSTPESPLLLDISLSSAEVSIRELLRNIRKRLKPWVRDLSLMLGSLINSRPREPEVSLSTLPSTSSRLRSTMSPSSMPQDIETSSRTWLPELLRLMLPSLWSLLPQENSRLVFPLKDRPKSTLFWPSLSVSETSLFVLTRWIELPQRITMRLDSTKSNPKPPTSLRSSDSKRRTCSSSQSLDSWERTLLRNLTRCLGTRVFVSLILLIVSLLQLDHLIDHSDYHYKMFIRSPESELFQSEELRLEPLNQEWCAYLLHLESRLKSRLLSNIILNLSLLDQETTLVSTSKDLPLRTSLEDLLPPMLSRIPLKLVKPSLLRSSSWSTQDKSKTDTHLSSIATLLTLPVSSRKSSNLLTRELVRLCRKSLLTSRPEILPWLDSSQLNRWLLRLSRIIPLWEDSPSETWNRLSELVSSKRLPRRPAHNKYYLSYLFFDFFLYKWILKRFFWIGINS